MTQLNQSTHFADSSDEEIEEASKEAAKILQYKEAVIAATRAGIDITDLTPDELIDMMLLPSRTPTSTPTPPPASSKGIYIFLKLHVYFLNQIFTNFDK